MSDTAENDVPITVLIVDDEELLVKSCGQILSSEGYTVYTEGRGKNALDAMILLFSSVGLWRQQLRPTARVHGIIREGGTAANIIPDRTAAWFMLRSDDRAYYEEMKRQFAT